MTDDAEIYRRQGIGARMGFGERPALLIIDFINAFNDPDQLGGGNIQSAIDHTVELLSVARHMEMPIVYTSHVYAADGSEDGLFNLKMPNMKDILTPGSHAVAVVDELAPRAGERIISKHYPSAFFGTDLSGWLAAKGVDTAIVTGCTTSGCVRATVVDAMGYGFRPMVPVECVGDRAKGPHESNLFDMDQKYADVMALADVFSALDELSPGQSGAAN
ncbi:MAG: isochorismatase family protein [Alphaproteobacteria bacterium]